MVTSRVHIVMGAEERARYRAQAALDGESLSEWLRNAARARLDAARGAPLRDLEHLDAFFAECDAAESGREPDWDEHLAVIETSRRPDVAT